VVRRSGRHDMGTALAWVAVGAAAAAALPRVAAGTEWRHGWDTTAASTFADFNANALLTDAQAKFVAEHYRVVSLEKCSGIANTTTENAIYTTAAQLKKIDPTIKVFFYLATDQQGIQCYAANSEFQAHPEWWLKDDNGNVVMTSGHPILDVTNAAGAAWWRGIPLSGDGNGTFGGVPVGQLIDGVLADSGGYSYYPPNISEARLEAFEDAKFAMIGELQRTLTDLNGGLVMANGISMYGAPHEDPRHPDGHNLRVLGFANAIMNEHTAVFECVNRNNASFNVETTSQDLDAITTAAQAANGSKMVFVQTWPGLYSATGFTPRGSTPANVYPPVANGGEPTPQNNAEWRAALREHFGFAHALYLSIAEPNIYWFYGGYWYPSNTGIIACPEDPDACPAPPEWYPALNRPLGAPLGPRTLVAPYVWTREFEHASVRLDLNQPNASAVNFKNA